MESSHIPRSRLQELAQDAVLWDRAEADHLKHCETCRALLRAYADERRKRTKSPRSGKAN